MSRFNVLLFVVIPIFAVIIGLLYVFINNDVNKSISEYEKKTGKKVRVKKNSLPADVSSALNTFQKYIEIPLNYTKKEKKPLLRKKKQK
ncbi:MAG: hypothetical protein RR922_05765 [Clostridia bacterium]